MVVRPVDDTAASKQNFPWEDAGKLRFTGLFLFCKLANFSLIKSDQFQGYRDMQGLASLISCIRCYDERISF